MAPDRPLFTDYTIEDNKIKLHWRPSPRGTQPQYYEIFASNESGFSPESEPHLVLGLSPLPRQENFLERKYININDVKGELVKIPGNLILKTQDTSAIVVDEKLSFSAGFNRCYYRLQAVDEYGARSGCTAQIELPRPFIYTRPPTTIKLAQPFTYQVMALYSLGPVLAGKTGYTYSLQKVEQIKFSLEGAPEGLKLNPYTGLLSGIMTSLPDDGETSFRIIATINGRSTKQEVKLKVIP
ncbi:MAG: Ig domain-containing protein [Candidatus Sumerlaeia bacterium]|nr:Ig domain-containing protein [Candidatus Sumerlaeia bacterium]